MFPNLTHVIHLWTHTFPVIYDSKATFLPRFPGFRRFEGNKSIFTNFQAKVILVSIQDNNASVSIKPPKKKILEKIINEIFKHL